jgi:hypothetical protein
LYAHNLFNIKSEKTQVFNKYEIRVRTKKENGLVLYTGNGKSKSFLALAFTAGRIVFSFSLPKLKQTVSLSSPNKLNDNKWHMVTIERTKRRAELIIDSNIKLQAFFDETYYIGFGSLNVDGYVRVGGYRKLPTGLPWSYYHGFQGCIAKFKIEDRLVDIVENNLNKRYFPNMCSSEKKDYQRNNTTVF